MIEAFHFPIFFLLLITLAIIRKIFSKRSMAFQGAVIATVVGTIVLLVWRIVTIVVYMPLYYARDDWSPFIGGFTGLIIGGIGGAIYLGVFLGGLANNEDRTPLNIIWLIFFGALYGGIMMSVVWSVTVVPGNPYSKITDLSDDILSLVGIGVGVICPLIGMLVGRITEKRIRRLVEV